MITIDNVDLLRYAMEIITGKCDNDLDEEDIIELRTFVEELIESYLNHDTEDMESTDLDFYRCSVCGKRTLSKLIYSGDLNVVECQVCGNLEVL